jgi:hypothetical protein
MVKILAGCAAAALVGVTILVAAPRLVGVGIALVVISAVLALQATLLAVVRWFTDADSAVANDSIPKTPDRSELATLFLAYSNFRLFLARAVGYVGLLFGIVTMNAYYIGLSAALIVLFWTLDRMDMSRRLRSDNCGTPDSTASH